MNVVRWWRIRRYRCLECGKRLDADGVCPTIARQRRQWLDIHDGGTPPYVSSWPTAEGQP